MMTYIKKTNKQTKNTPQKNQTKKLDYVACWLYAVAILPSMANLAHWTQG